MKRKCLAIGIILLFLGTCIIPAVAQDTQKTQSTSRGNWLYVGGSGPGNYTKIQDAVDNASDGDTVFVYDDSSPYFENVMVNKSINLFGENRETTIIDANKSGSPINLNTSFITICGFTVQNSGENEIGVESGIVRDYHSSPFPRVCDNITIMGNIIINNKFGIYFSYSNNISIINNIITQNKHCGILCTRTHTSTIEHNEVTKNDEGIGIYSSGSTEITHNHIKENNVSIRLWGSSINHISENSILNSSDTGIILDGNVNTRIKANNFINNTNDAYFEYAILPFTGNRFINNYWDSNTGSGPKTIIGTYEMALLSVTIGILAAYILGGYGFPEIIIKWFVFDWNPAKEPYDIPGMS